MNHLGGDVEGQTPLDLDEAKQLIPSWIATRGDLNVAETDNIIRARIWSRRLRLAPDAILANEFLHELHRRMFGDVWAWAGSYRATARNLGVEPWMIGQEVGVLLGDARYWLDHGLYTPDESAVRFHHRLVWIHAFPNGNGRHAREAADLLAQSLGGRPFTWGQGLASTPQAMRDTYIAALRAADGGEIAALLDFVRR